jgi:hypothetical protein
VSVPVDHDVVDVEVDVDPVPVTTPHLADSVQGAVGDLDQGVSVRHPNTVALEQGVSGFAQRSVDDGAVVAVEFAA